MTLFPAYSDFETVYNAGKPQIVWSRLIADLETPVSVMLKLAAGRPNSFLLESVEGGEVRGRYSVIGMKPDIVWRAYGNRAEINRKALYSDTFAPCAADTLESLRALLEESRLPIPETLPPMSAGVFGYLGYDTVRLVEHLPNINPDPLGLPDGVMMRPTLIITFDSVKDELIISTPVRPLDGVDARAAYARAGERIQDVAAELDRGLSGSHETIADLEIPKDAVSNTTKAEYLDMVKRAKDYIAAGDIFQVVPSQRFQVPFQLPPFALYRSLRRVNPSPYLYYLDFGDFAVVGSSPEILVQVRDDQVAIRPIAGTRPRGASPERDRANAAELLADPKERAEHLMLLDLGRNDVGRVAKINSVRVREQFVLEYYSHVMHIVSHVTGALDTDKYDAIDALMAGFPAGTVSGAPKVRAMEIIDELEKEKRGIYAGCVGYFAADGNMDTCIVLRTALVKDGTMYVQAGGGVVADSDPEAEFMETVHKSQALIAAAQDAVQFASTPKRGQ